MQFSKKSFGKSRWRKRKSGAKRKERIVKRRLAKKRRRR
jgi:hypothetical protein